MLPGLLRYDDDIELNMEVVIVSTKGEAVALGNFIKYKYIIDHLNLVLLSNEPT